MYLCDILTENNVQWMKRRLSRDLVNTSKGSCGLYTGGEFSKACKHKIMHTPRCSTLKSKLVPEEAIKCVSMVLRLKYLACWEAWLTILLSCHSSTAGQLSGKSQGCSWILCWHFHEKFRNFQGDMNGIQDISLLHESHLHQLTKLLRFLALPGPNYFTMPGAQHSFHGVGSVSSLTLFASHLLGQGLKCQYHI